MSRLAAQPRREGAVQPLGCGRAGFTLIELVVVIVVIAVLAAVAVPRLMASRNGKGQVEAEAIASLFTKAARRQMLTTLPIAVDYDVGRRAIGIVSLKPSDLTNFDNKGQEWVDDTLIPRVPLETLDVLSATSNDTTLAPSHFRAQLSDPSGRVAFSMVVRDHITGSEWTILLPLTADHAVLADGRDPRDVRLDPDTVDLDDAGRREVPW